LDCSFADSPGLFGLTMAEVRVLFSPIQRPAVGPEARQHVLDALDRIIAKYSAENPKVGMSCRSR
jgi:hypothetical protein